MNFLKKFRRQRIDSRCVFSEKYLSFQALLRKNNTVLEIIADMEEKLSGEFLFDMHYIESSAAACLTDVNEIITSMNRITGDKYRILDERFEHIARSIETAIARKREIPIGPYTIPFNEITSEMLSSVGGKNAHLGEVKNRINMPAPDGFAITAFAFKRFMEHNGFIEKINNKLSGLDMSNMEAINGASKEIQDMVIQAEMPDDIENAIQQAVDNLRLKVQSSPPLNPPLDKGGHGGVRVSVRSSAIQEDGEFSFAGQYSTFLNVPLDFILQRYKEVVASLFTSRAIFYYKTKGFDESEMVMSVGVIEMVDAKAGGVIYSRDPNDPKKNIAIINSAHGLGKSVVDGAITPQTYIVATSPDIA
ncbi:MAG: PEP/pyruvate-binding domain-containing protein, partial [Nitrospirae bacterium]|nr:PEP/pyruvate-binding domain-containing protein [Nitrospirota bacterium]